MSCSPSTARSLCATSTAPARWALPSLLGVQWDRMERACFLSIPPKHQTPNLYARQVCRHCAARNKPGHPPMRAWKQLHGSWTARQCPACGRVCDRDVNAAHNICTKGVCLQAVAQLEALLPVRERRMPAVLCGLMSLLPPSTNAQDVGLSRRGASCVSPPPQGVLRRPEAR